MKKVILWVLTVLMLCCLSFSMLACDGFGGNGGNDNEEEQHTHEYTAVVTDPTCTEKGYTTYTCECGDNYKDNETEVLGHLYLNYVSNGEGNAVAECGREDCTVTDTQPDGALYLEYELNNDETGYIITGIGEFSGNDLIILSGYNNKPVVSIGNWAFDGCDKLEYTEYENGYYLGNENNPHLVLIEAKDRSITSCTINENTKIIADYAFSRCNSLTSITIPDSVTSIGSEAFCFCSSLTSVTIPDSVTEIDYYAFRDCSSLTSVYYTGTIDKWVSIDFDNAFSNPLSNGADLYINNQKVTEVNITTATEIKEYAFSYCSSLESVTIGDSVTSIGYSAFIGCSSLTSITIGDSVTSISWYAFYDCDKLEYTEYKNGYYIGNENNPHLVLIKAKNTSITSCTINENTKFIADYAFSRCNSLTSITIGDSVTSIGSEAFCFCSSLTSVTIGDSVTSIGNRAFENCSSLTSVTIGDSVTSIGSEAFGNCDSLESITVDASNANYSIQDGVLYNKHKTELICYPAGKTDTTYTSPASVTEIGDSAFFGCDILESVIIGGSVTSIGSYAFSHCSSLTTIIYDGTKEQWNNIRKDDFWNYYTGDYTVLCTDGTIE